MRIKFVVVALLLVLELGLNAEAQTPPVTGVDNVRLRNLAGTQTMVTVVLEYAVESNESGVVTEEMREARDSNLRILSVQSDRMIVLTEDNDELPYLFNMVKEVQVQGGKVEKRALLLRRDVLSAADQEVVQRAQNRVKEIFEGSSAKQNMKMKAAVLLALDGNEDAKKYLEQLSNSSELRTELQAGFALYLAGEEVEERLMSEGLESGSRLAKSQACTLSGLYNYSNATSFIKTMLADRQSEISSPASRALARMGDREVIEHLYSVLGDSNAERADAAVWGLIALGGDDIIQQMEMRTATAEGNESFRIAKVLYALKKEEGKRLLREVYTEYPTLKQEVAYILAQDKDYDTENYLRSRLSERMNETESTMVMRAKIAGSLIASGDPQAKAIYQEILRGDIMAAKKQVLHDITKMGSSQLLNVIQSSIENVDTELSLMAATAAIAISDSEFRARLLTLRDEVDW